MIKRMYINEEFDSDLEQLAKETVKKILRIIDKYDFSLPAGEDSTLLSILTNRRIGFKGNILIYSMESDNDYKLVFQMNNDPVSVWIVSDNKLVVNVFGTNPSENEIKSLQKMVTEIQDVKSEYMDRKDNM